MLRRKILGNMTHVYGSFFQVTFGWLFLLSVLCKLSTMSIYYWHSGKLNKNRVTTEHMRTSQVEITNRGRNILKKKKNVILYEWANNEYKLSKQLMREKTFVYCLA